MFETENNRVNKSAISSRLQFQAFEERRKHCIAVEATQNRKLLNNRQQSDKQVSNFVQFKQKLIVSRNRFNHDARNQQSEFQPSLPLVFSDSTPVTSYNNSALVLKMYTILETLLVLPP
ncbi:hypothetical protein POM88_006176 [Heracleum sosnowskyi]|uniref:Uncharacterized protein n=1 Tax=Heracleum sosnowskyi TaxID=360622 RepID=A0AAD8J4D4_9APIA|nr:hypothetical protein POM88_006176 [Heracleum sosnowskyi]